VFNTSQPLTKGRGRGRGPPIKLGDKKEFGSLFTSLVASNFNFHVLKLLFDVIG